MQKQKWRSFFFFYKSFTHVNTKTTSVKENNEYSQYMVSEE
jgi:hypothetical protein